MPQIKKVLFILVIISSVILLPACGEATPVPSNELHSALPTQPFTPTGIPVTEPPPTQILPPTAFPVTPIASPEGSATSLPTNTPQIAVPFIETTGTPLVTPSSLSQLPQPCSLVTTDEVAGLFPNPPVPTSTALIQEAWMGSSCQYSDVQMNVSIVVLLRSSIHGKVDILENKVKLGSSYTSSGAEIYQLGGIDEQRQNNAFVGLILKGDIYVEITGTSQSYQYNADQVTSLLKNIAARLPDIPAVLAPPTACSLVTAEMAAVLLPNPPVPVSEVKENPPGTMCKFENEGISFSLSLSSSPDFLKQLEEAKLTFMAMFPDYTQSSVLGADIFQTGGPSNQSNSGNVFLAIIQKDNLYVLIQAEGANYHYDSAREAALLKAIVGRIP